MMILMMSKLHHQTTDEKSQTFQPTDDVLRKA